MTTRFRSKHLIAAIAAPLLALAGSATAGTYTVGTGPSYNQVDGDLTLQPPPTLGWSSGISLDAGVLTIRGGSGDDIVTVTKPDASTIVAKRGSYSASFSAVSVHKIVFYGNDGNDYFSNGTGLWSEAYGGNGNDILYGGSGTDFLVGGYDMDTLKGNAGADTLWGSGGADALYGGTGDDVLKGHGGNDQLYGDAGDDALYGGSGDDTLNGNADQDTLVTIGGNYDIVVGSTGNDFFWVDTTDKVSDASLTEQNEAYVNKVAGYYSYSYDGGYSTIGVAKDLTSYALLDPLAKHSNVTLASFADRPLFARGGPSKEDVLQGSADDCYILGPLSAVADATPDAIRKLVVDLEDGTYAVRLYRTEGGAPQYVRVDGDLWTWADGSLAYADLGVDDSTWVPIVEKAWAWFRDREGSYASIDGGNSGLGGSIGFAGSKERIDVGIHDASDILWWDYNGRDPGIIALDVQASVTQLLHWIADRQAEGRPVYTGYYPGVHNASSFDEDYWRRGAHIIMIDSVGFDASGNPISLTIRDQVGGVYRTYTDFARIYFFFGRAVTYDMP